MLLNAHFCINFHQIHPIKWWNIRLVLKLLINIKLTYKGFGLFGKWKLKAAGRRYFCLKINLKPRKLHTSITLQNGISLLTVMVYRLSKACIWTKVKSPDKKISFIYLLCCRKIRKCMSCYNIPNYSNWYLRLLTIKKEKKTKVSQQNNKSFWTNAIRTFRILKFSQIIREPFSRGQYLCPPNNMANRWKFAFKSQVNNHCMRWIWKKYHLRSTGSIQSAFRSKTKNRRA